MEEYLLRSNLGEKGSRKSIEQKLKKLFIAELNAVVMEH